MGIIMESLLQTSFWDLDSSFILMCWFQNEQLFNEWTVLIANKVFQWGDIIIITISVYGCVCPRLLVHMFACVCECACVWEQEREREREPVC